MTRFPCFSLVCLRAGLVAALSLAGAACTGRPPTVTVVRTPHDGLQPRAAVDAEGTVHLIYFKGAPEAGDLFYVRKAGDAERFSAPIQVNSQPGSAIAVGTIRGAQLALGTDDRVHVAWNGSGTAEPPGVDGPPMLYTRLNDAGTAFEPQRNLISRVGGLDGGGTIAADRQGNVYVLWHGGPAGTDEASRAVYLAHSADGGRTFLPERPVNPPETGVCGCCGMQAHTDAAGNLYVLYRAATDNTGRDMLLLASTDHGSTFEADTLGRWQATACPMSSAAFGAYGRDLIAAWQTGEQVYYATIREGSTVVTRRREAAGEAEARKHPAVAAVDGRILFAWTEGTGWNRGGRLAWEVDNSEGRMLGAPGRAEGVPTWSLPAAYHHPRDGFVVIY